MNDWTALLPLIVSLLAMLLAVLLWSNARNGQKHKANQQDPSGSQMFAKDIDAIAKLLPVSTQEKPDSPYLASLKNFKSAFEEWFRLVDRIDRSGRYANALGSYARDLNTFLSHVRDLPSMTPDPQTEDDIFTFIRKLVDRAVRITDRDLGKRATPELQKAILSMTQCAGLELIDPRPGTSYEDANRVTRIVKEVTTRGLRIKDGPTLRHPEIQESTRR